MYVLHSLLHVLPYLWIIGFPCSSASLPFFLCFSYLSILLSSFIRNKWFEVLLFIWDSFLWSRRNFTKRALGNYVALAWRWIPVTFSFILIHNTVSREYLTEFLRLGSKPSLLSPLTVVQLIWQHQVFWCYCRELLYFATRISVKGKWSFHQRIKIIADVSVSRRGSLTSRGWSCAVFSLPLLIYLLLSSFYFKA